MHSVDHRGHIAQARRLYLHIKAGGRINECDMGLIVEAMEQQDAEIERMRAIITSSGILATARRDPALAPPFRLTVGDCRAMCEELGARWEDA